MGFSSSLWLRTLLWEVMFLLPLLSPYHLLALSNSPFPTNNFILGTASSSYQYEGAYKSEGKGFSNWDNFTHGPGRSRIMDGSSGDIAVDHYHRYLEDIDLIDALKVNSHRFSISWARILPKGRFGEVNWAGIDFYNRLIDALLLKGIQPFVTLSHYDNPQELEDRYGGWLSPQSQDDFAYYADLCFKTFGDRVKYWITFNEPNIVVPMGYRSGIFPPCRCSSSLALVKCREGDSEKEPFVAAHNIILSHAAAVHIYRTKYQTKQRGTIGIVLQHEWYEPISNSTADKLATERARSFFFNWFLDPIMFGKYPTEMENILGSLLPKFSNKDKEKLKKGLDFIGINYYTAYYVKDCIYSTCKSKFGVSKTEGSYMKSGENNGIPIGEPTSFSWLNIYPEGMEKTITYVKNRYNNTPMFITENGYGEEDHPNFTLEEHRNDSKRIEYMEDHIEAMLAAIRKGADVRGYFAWSLLDNFEWIYGYTVRYGFHHVDYATLKRTPRLSASWYKQFIAKIKGTTGLEKLVEEAKKLRKTQVELLAPLIRKRKSYVESDGKLRDPEMVSAVGAAYVDSLFALEVPDRGRLGEEELVTLVSEVISAGTDTSATAVEWALLHLVMDQGIQEKLYKEIVGCVGKGGDVKEADVEKMPYLSAIVKETFRRHPPSHFVLSHAATEETELGGYTVPKDASVEFYTAWLSEDPDMWEDPDEFRPERFLIGDGVDADITGTKAVRMMPFGAGRRICPAWTLGVLHINMLLAKMVLAFQWLPVPGAPPDPSETFAFTVVMKNSLKAVIIPRSI